MSRAASRGSISTPEAFCSFEPMAPTSRPWAVTVEALSTTTTFAPASAALWAEAQPAMPAPMTATSHSMVLVFALAIVILLFCPAARIPNLAFAGSL